MAAKITKDGLWRVSYGEIPGLTPEEVHPHSSNFPLSFLKRTDALLDGRQTTHEIRANAPRQPQTRSIQASQLQSLQNAPTLRRKIPRRTLPPRCRCRPFMQPLGRSGSDWWN